MGAAPVKVLPKVAATFALKPPKVPVETTW